MPAIRGLSLSILSFGLVVAAAAAQAAGPDIRPGMRQRVIVMTDIGGDPDDQQSMVRQLLYANDMKIEGLLATANSRGVFADRIHERINAYEEVYANLLVHNPNYPKADELRRLVKSGVAKRYIEQVGTGKSTEASQHIIDVVERPDERPVWVTVWGAPTDLAQALWDVRATRGESEVAAFVNKLRIYDIGGQDDTGAWICRHFPDVFYLRSVMQFQAISRHLTQKRLTKEVTGPNLFVFEDAWIAEHVQSHGPLGRWYVPRKYKYEGDTPAFLYLVPNGLSNPEMMHHGNWGGRFNAWRTVNAGAFSQKYFDAQMKHRPYAMHTEATDTWSYEGRVYANSSMAPLFRWRDAFQNDFAARMDWSITPQYQDANHNPIAAIERDDSIDTIYRSIKGGQRLVLSAGGSRDPDGDELSYRWWFYPEPGTWHGELMIEGADGAEATVVTPRVFSDRVIHLILEVTDDGEPALTSYKRMVVNLTYL